MMWYIEQSVVRIMKRETSIKQGNGNSGKRSSKHNSQAVTSNGKLAEQVAPDTGTVKRDYAAGFAKSANEHMLRAWESIHKNGKERKAS